MSPKEFRVTLETVTPLFLGGAEPRGRPVFMNVRDGNQVYEVASRIEEGEPELRVSAFRGMFRYWLRAVAGGVIGDHQLRDLHKLESAVFGSTENGSRIHIKPDLPSMLTDSPTMILPHKRNEGRQAAWRRAIDPNQTFDLIITSRLGCSETVWKTALSMIEFSLTFGGVGLRARRGYGTLRIIDPPNMRFPQSEEEIEIHLQRVISQAINTVKKLATELGIKVLKNAQPGPTKYPTLNQKVLIWLGQQLFSTPTEAIAAFMRKTRSVDYLGFAHGKHKQSSPLWVRFIKVTNSNSNNYQLLISTLPSSFIGSNYDELEKFVKSFPGKPIQIPGWNA